MTESIETEQVDPPADLAKLYTALAQAQAEYPIVAKGKAAKGSGGFGGFTYATFADYAATIYEILGKHGLAFTALPQWYGQRGFHLIGRLTHSSGTHIEGMLPLQGVKAQEIGASLSYSRRQLFTAMTGAASDDETPAEKANTQTAERAKNPNSRASTKKKAASAATQVQEGAKPDPWADAIRQDDAGGARINEKQNAAMHALFKEIGVEDRTDRLDKTSTIVGRLVSSSGELSHAEAATLLDALTKRRDALIADGTIAAPEAGPCSACGGINNVHSRTCPTQGRD